MNIENIKNALLKSNYLAIQAEAVAEELLQVDSRLLSMVELWVSSGEETDYSVNNFSILDVKNKFDMTYPAALLTIDWIIKDPKVAIEAISHGIK